MSIHMSNEVILKTKRNGNKFLSLIKDGIEMKHIVIEMMVENGQYMLRKECRACTTKEYDYIADVIREDFEETNLVMSSERAITLVGEFIEMHESCIKPSKVN